MRIRCARLALLCAALCGVQLPSHGQATIQTLLTNGPTSRLINIVFFSEGYTSAELPGFITDARAVLNRILTTQPYRSYSNLFNAFGISVASAQSGSDHYTPSVSLVNTYFNSTFDSYGIQRLVTIPPNNRDGNYANGQGKIDGLIRDLMPECDLPIMLVNDNAYGGSGGPTLIASINVSSAEIAVHEMGHTFVGLGDEYSDPYPGYPDIEEPNTTRQTNRAQVKWNAWILPSTPVPTPNSSTYDSAVGLFEGAHYHATGWYRPRRDCKMRTLGQPFCEVCREASVLATFGIVRPLQSFSPTTSGLILNAPGEQTFTVGVIRPPGGVIRVQWFTNNVADSAATNTNFVVAAQSLGPGNHAVRAEVWDATPFVRTDVQQVLRDTNVWTVLVQAPPTITSQPQSQAVRIGSNATFTVTATGSAPLRYRWRFNGTNLANATAATLTVTNTRLANAGDYTVVITNLAGTVTSSPATLTVTSAPVVLQAQAFSNAQFTFALAGEAGQRYAIEFSNTLTNWTLLEWVTNGTGLLHYVDRPTNGSRRFYRVTLLP